LISRLGTNANVTKIFKATQTGADATSALLSAQLELVELFWRTWFETASKACVSVLVAVAGSATAAQTKLLEIPTMGSPIRHITEVIVREAVRDRAGPIRR